MKPESARETGFKARLLAQRPALCCLSNMASPVAAEILGHSGYDAVMIDMEHGPGDMLNTVAQMQALAGTGAAALVRVPENSAVYLKRVLDAGPDGVMVPAVSTGPEAEKAVAACRYPPKGIRGVAHPIARAANYGVNVERYIGETEKNLLVICQIETLAGVDNAAAIAAADSVDMIFIGPMDLSASAGRFNEPDHPDVAALIERVEREVTAAGKMLGGLATAARPAANLFDRGYRLVIDAIDIALLRDAALRNVAAAKSFTEG